MAQGTRFSDFTELEVMALRAEGVLLVFKHGFALPHKELLSHCKESPSDGESMLYLSQTLGNPKPRCQCLQVVPLPWCK